MKKQKALPKNEKGQKIDGRHFPNRNPQKWFLEHDEALREAIDQEKAKALLQGKRLSQRQIILRLAKDKTLLDRIPRVRGNQRLTHSSEKTYARLAKRAQHPNAILPPVARALGLGQRTVDIAALRAEIEDSVREHLRTSIAYLLTENFRRTSFKTEAA